MKLDVEDVFASGIGNLLLQAMTFAAAVWLSMTVAEVSYLAGDLARGSIPPYKLRALAGILPGWSAAGICLLAAAYFKMVRISSPTIRWGLAIALFSIVLLGFRMSGQSSRPGPVVAAWMVCAVQLGMIGTGLWFLRQWQINRWAGEMAMLKSENAMRRAELKDLHGIESVGQDEWEQD